MIKNLTCMYFFLQLMKSIKLFILFLLVSGSIFSQKSTELGIHLNTGVFLHYKDEPNIERFLRPSFNAGIYLQENQNNFSYGVELLWIHENGKFESNSKIEFNGVVIIDSPFPIFTPLQTQTELYSSTYSLGNLGLNVYSKIQLNNFSLQMHVGPYKRVYSIEHYTNEITNNINGYTKYIGFKKQYLKDGFSWSAKMSVNYNIRDRLNLQVSGIWVEDSILGSLGLGYRLKQF